ncbi:MAG: outer membrane beta-barrel protein, partial [Hyphomicrobiaceae bacterium]
GLASFYNEHSSEDDRAWRVEGRGRLDLTHRTNLEAYAFHDVSQDDPGSASSTATANGRPNITVDEVGTSLNHRFNRLSLQLRGSVADRTVGTLQGDPNISESDRDYSERKGAFRAQWEFKPEFSVFGEVGLEDRDYKRASYTDGIRRNSSGERYRVGVAFGNSGQILRGEASIGTGRQTFDDDRLPKLKGVIVDANLAWRVSGLTTVKFSANTDFGDSTVAGSGGTVTNTAGVEVRHAFRRHLIGTAGITYSHAKYDGVSLTEDTLTSTAQLEYYVNRDITLFGRYAHIDFNSSAIDSDYTADEMRIGMRIRR